MAVPPRSDGKAVASLLLGVMSITCLGVIAGLPAIVLGALARRDIDRAHGRLTGSGLAAAGIVSGLFGTGASLLIAVAILGTVLETKAPEASDAPVRVPIAAGTRSYGTLDVVDLDEGRPLRAQLADVTKAAHEKGRTVVVHTYVRHSRECAELGAALPDPRMQRALANVTLVRVDVDVHEADLHALRVQTDSVPWFYKLDARGRPVDAIGADEWDENVPANMAPVLGAFVRGTLTSRRSPSTLGTDL